MHAKRLVCLHTQQQNDNHNAQHRDNGFKETQRVLNVYDIIPQVHDNVICGGRIVRALSPWFFALTNPTNTRLTSENDKVISQLVRIESKL